MKKIIYIILMLFFITSCNEKDMEYNDINWDSTKFVVFSNTELSVNELVYDPIEIVAVYAASGDITNLSVPFTINSSAVEGVNYTIVDNKTSFNFSNGNLTDSIFIMPIDDIEASGDKILTLSLNSSEVNIGYPGPNSLNSELVLTIIDNDCPYTLDELAQATWAGTDNASGDEGPNDSQIEMAYDGTTFTMEGIAYGWLTGGYWDEVVVDSYPVVVDFNTTTSTFTFDLQDLCTTTWNGSPQPGYSISGSGSYDSCSSTMTISYDLYQGGAVLRSYTEIITK
jgi:hypothetical protein